MQIMEKHGLQKIIQYLILVILLTGANPQFAWTGRPPGLTIEMQAYTTSFCTLNAGQDGTFAGTETAQGNTDDCRLW